MYWDRVLDVKCWAYLGRLRSSGLRMPYAVLDMRFGALDRASQAECAILGLTWKRYTETKRKS